MAPSDIAEGQINPNQVPPDPHSHDPPAPKKAKVAKGMKTAAAVASSSASGSDSDPSAGSAVDPDTVVIDPPAKLAKMQSERRRCLHCSLQSALRAGLGCLWPVRERGACVRERGACVHEARPVARANVVYAGP
jgi:hypothetical protein